MVYQGSKNRYAKYIVPILQDAIDKSGYDTFIDGCCGGCNIIDKIKCKKKIAIDNNKYLIAFLRHIVTEGLDFIPDIAPSKTEWGKVKSNKEEYQDWYVGFIEHLCSYNGRGFVGSYGVATSNSSRDYYAERKRNIAKQIKALEGTEFVVGDINNLQCKNCVIYIDPPYNNTQKYDSLVDNPFDYNKFWDTVRKLSKNNLVFVSEEQAPEDFEIIWQNTAKRNIGNSKKVVIEKLFKLKS